MFPVWDAAFGTFCIPNDNKDIIFGLKPDKEDNYKSCKNIYFLPFKSAGIYILNRCPKN